MNDFNLPAVMSVEEFKSWSRMGRTKIYAMLGTGELTAIKVGRRTLITLEAASAWLQAQPDYASPVHQKS